MKSKKTRKLSIRSMGFGKVTKAQLDNHRRLKKSAEVFYGGMKELSTINL
jgi:hypothetical protein